MNRYIIKDLLIEIRKTWPRFLSILSITLLGVAFYVGINAASPSMIKTSQDYFERYDLPDGVFASTYGLNQQDYDFLKNFDLEINPIFSLEAKIQELNEISKVFPYNQEPFFYAIEGDLPSKRGEIALDVLHLNDSIHIGDKVNLEAINKGTQEAIEGYNPPSLNQKTYTVTGFVDASIYFSKVTRGVSNISSFALIHHDDIIGDLATEIYFWNQRLTNQVAYSEKYQDEMALKIKEIEEQLPQLASDKWQATKEDFLKLLDEGTKEVRKGYQELAKAYRELKRGERIITKNQTLLEDGIKELTEGQKELEKSEREIEDGLAEIASSKDKLASEQEKLRNAENDFQLGLNQYLDGKALFEQKMIEANDQIASQLQQLDEGKEKLNQNRLQLEQAQEELSKNEDSLNSSQVDLIGKLHQEIPDWKEKIQFIDQLANEGAFDEETNQRFINQEANDIDYALAILKESFVPLETALNDIELNLPQLVDQLKNLENAKSQLDSQATGLFEEKNQLQERREQLVAGLDELDTTIARIDEEIALNHHQISSNNARILTIDEALYQATEAEDLTPYQAEREELIAQNSNFEQENASLSLERASLVENLELHKNELESLEDALTTIGETLSDIQNNLLNLDSQIPLLREQTTVLENQKTDLLVNYNDLESQIQELESAKRQFEEGASQILKGKEELQKNNEALEKGYQELEEGYSSLSSHQSKLETEKATRKAAFEAAALELDSARQRIEDGQAQLNSGFNQLEEATNQIAQGQKDLAQGRKTLNQESLRLKDAQEELEKAIEALEEGRQTYEDQRLEAIVDIREGQEKLEDLKEALAELKEPTFFLDDRENFDSYLALYDNAQQIKEISKIFPLFFFLIAILVTFTTIRRMASEQRNLMGTLKQMGYSNGTIVSKFLIYALMASTIGIGLGIVSGYRVFPGVILNAYNRMFHFDNPQIVRSLQVDLTVSAIALLCALGPAIYTPMKMLKAAPVELLHPEAPKAGKKILLERITWIWHKLSFNQKMTFRNIFRYKGRNLMTVIGVAGCTMLIVTGFGISDTVSSLVEKQFNELQKFDAQLLLKETVKEETMIQKVTQMNPSTLNLPVRFESWQSTGQEAVQKVSVIAMERLDPTFIQLKPLTDNEPIDLFGNGDIVISKRLAEYLGLEIGDSLKLIKDDQTLELPISKITENYIEHYVYLSKENFEKYTGSTYEVNSLYLQYQDDDNIHKYNDTLSQDSDILSVISTDKVKQTVEQTTGSLKVITLVLTVSAAGLAFIVLYNLTNINVMERIKELATIKVLGFYSREVSIYIFNEILDLTVLGSLIGLGLGTLLNRFILKTIQLPNLYFQPQINVSSYLIACALTFIFSATVMLMMHLKIKKINMVEALKAVE